jgi:hypothetical protein
VTDPIAILPELRDKRADDLSADKTPEELRGMTPDDMARFVEVLDAHLRSIHQTDEGELREKSTAEQTAFTYGLKLRDIAISKIDEHRAVQEVFKRRPKAVEAAMLNIGRNSDDAYGDVRRMTNEEVRTRALRSLDDRNSAGHLRSDQKDEVEKQIRKSGDIARRILVTENEHYREAWMKLVTDPQAAGMLTEDERQAIRAFQEYRVMSEGTTTAGGFGIPVMAAA